MFNSLRLLVRDESGAMSVEYALLLGVLGVGMLAGALGGLERATRAADRFEVQATPASASQGEAHVVGVIGN